MRLLISILLTLVLVATSCGSGDDSAVQTDGGEAATSAGAGSQDGRPQSFDDLDFSSPIGEFLGSDFGDTENMEQQFADMEREVQLMTAECMIEKGFEYTPQGSGDTIFFGGPGGDEVPYFSDEWVAKYGFGITTQRFPQSMVGDLVGFPDEEFNGPDEDFVDPNMEYLDSLSDGEREAYQEALWGQPPEFEGDDPDERFDFQPSGCQGNAMTAVFEEGPGGGQAFYNAFGDKLEAMEERAKADPRFVQFNDGVTECVSAAGMTWVDQQELYDRFESRLSGIETSVYGSGPGDPFEEAGLDPEAMSQREIDEFFADRNRLDPETQSELASLQAEELALAEVVIGCGGGPLNEQWVLGEVRVEYEQEFLDQNADALAEFKDE